MARRQPCRDYLCLLPDLRAVRFSQAAGKPWSGWLAPDCRDGRNGSRRNSLQLADAAPEHLAIAVPATSHRALCFSISRISFAYSHRPCRVHRSVVPDWRRAGSAYRHAGHASALLDGQSQSAPACRPGHRRRLFGLQYSRILQCIRRGASYYGRSVVPCRSRRNLFADATAAGRDARNSANQLFIPLCTRLLHGACLAGLCRFLHHSENSRVEGWYMGGVDAPLCKRSASSSGGAGKRMASSPSRSHVCPLCFISCAGRRVFAAA